MTEQDLFLLDDLHYTPGLITAAVETFPDSKELAEALHSGNERAILIMATEIETRGTNAPARSAGVLGRLKVFIDEHRRTLRLPAFPFPSLG